MKITQPICEKCGQRSKSLLNFCAHHEIDRVNTSKTCNYYKRGQVIFQEGGMPLGFYCVNEGTVKLVKGTSDGKEQIIRLANAGDTLGYRSLLTHKHYTSSAVAAEDCKICIIPRHEFYDLINHNDNFQQAVINLLCESNEELEGKMTHIAYKPVRGRIAEALIVLSRKKEANGTISLTRGDLASLVGTVKETAIRTLSEFKQEKLIEIDNRSIKVLDLNGLVKISNLYD
jgi:CRP-like cAMP-binding protein